MKILIVTTLFRPHLRGGAEISASNLATWLIAKGHEVGVLTAADSPQKQVVDAAEEGARVWRLWVRRPYAAIEAASASALKKPLWHMLDLYDPGNPQTLRKVLDAFRPDVVNVQYIQGLGYNMLPELRDIPTVFTLHDLGLACLRMAMFKRGGECADLCMSCEHTAKTKFGYLSKIERLGFIAPSKSVLGRLSELQPIGEYPSAVIQNVNRYPDPTVPRVEDEIPRLLFVGRLHASKGIHLLLEALEPLAQSRRFSLRVLGSGPAESELKSKYGHHEWLSLEGHVSQQDVANAMENSEILLVPSIWMENSPGVVIQALSLGLPVIGSDKGGIPELVQHGENGKLVEAGNLEQWRSAIDQLLANPRELATLRHQTKANMTNFSEDRLGSEMVKFFNHVASTDIGRHADPSS